jgi:predicted DNA-binding transcriptional regulator AlpA
MTLQSLHPAVHEDETLLNSAQVRRLFGGVSTMWIPRRRAEGSGFPQSIQIGKRNFWRLGELRQWRDAQFRKQDKTRPPPRNKK